MKGFKTFVIFGLIGLLGLVTALEGIDLKPILLPLACQVDPAVVMAVDSVSAGCVEKITKLIGYWTAGLGALGVGLRMITSSPIFKKFIE